MKKLIFIALAVVAVAASGQAPVEGGVNSSYSYENAIQVNGVAERKVVPDEIYVRIVINEKEMKLNKSVEQMERAMITALKNGGVDTDKNLKIDQMSSDYKNYFLKPGQVRSSATYELKVSSAQELGRVYQTLEAEGISNMSVTRQTHSRLREIQGELRVEAMKNAREVAEQLAAAEGLKVGPAVYINDFGNQGGGVMYKMRSLAGDANRMPEAYETPLQMDDLDLTYSVSVKFALDGVAN